ncbi:hypothetical protein E2C01_033551 [Portunus trituberculatus]|uniref:Uncharacterized protein n=1 Tax=Portunus trituberculatus TaxID=210409 RepID=A0A5B7F378_PORTR|nr:hypothetical protein [Portunus trituberculatus]
MLDGGGGGGVSGGGGGVAMGFVGGLSRYVLKINKPPDRLLVSVIHKTLPGLSPHLAVPDVSCQLSRQTPMSIPPPSKTSCLMKYEPRVTTICCVVKMM